MGGKLYNLPRMPRAEYLAREAEVRRCLDDLLPGGTRIPRHYGDKPDFGDMDILVADRPDWPAARAEIFRALGITEMKSIGHVSSTVYRGLQTDFFLVPARFLDAAYDFMSFNDVGNFIGRICRRFDLKYGERGLVYVYRRAAGNYAADLEVSIDFARTAAFLGLDHVAWLAGFPSLYDVFEWVIASPYFSVAPYVDDARGTLERRARDRPNVKRFIDHLRARGVDKRPELGPRGSHLPTVIAAFPEAGLASQIAREQAAEARHVAAAAKLGGNRVMRLVPGLAGRALGDFIRGFRDSHADFESWVIATPEDEIDRCIVEAAGAAGLIGGR